ncbi:hypothetical protein ACJ41O_002501 [Fusarium nematophilum]
MDTDPDYFPSASSSIILLDEPDLSNSIYRDKIDAIMGNDPDREHPAPPTSEASMSIALDSSAASQMPEDEDMADEEDEEEPWTIVPSLRTASSASDTTAGPAPASDTRSVHNLTASNIFRLDQLNDPRPPRGSRPSVASPGSKAPPKRSHTRASDMSPPDLTEPYSPAAGNESAWGLCGVGAWADMASPVILAKKPGTSSRRQ